MLLCIPGSVVKCLILSLNLNNNYEQRETLNDVLVAMATYVRTDPVGAVNDPSQLVHPPPLAVWEQSWLILDLFIL